MQIIAYQYIRKGQNDKGQEIRLYDNWCFIDEPVDVEHLELYRKSFVEKAKKEVSNKIITVQFQTKTL